jgi:hypothetical protein
MSNLADMVELDVSSWLDLASRCELLPFGHVSAGMTYDKFLARKSVKDQSDVEASIWTYSKSCEDLRYGHFGHHLITQAHHVARCERTHSCNPCAIVESRRVGAAIFLAAPEFIIVLTLASGDFNVTRTMKRKWIREIRKEVPSFEVAWTVEQNPAITGFHIHSYAHANEAEHVHLSPDLVARAAIRAGFGPIAYIKKVAVRTVSFCGYVLKGIASDFPGFLRVNNGASSSRMSLIHATGKFWRDGPSGEIFKDRATAQTCARQRWIEYRRFERDHAWEFDGRSDDSTFEAALCGGRA